jgi:hypothetical protein
MTDHLHSLANQTTPAEVTVPHTWGGLIVWAAGKWGVGIVFLVLLVPVYQDLKESNKRVADITQANVQVLTALAAKIESTNAHVQRIDDSIRRLEGKP